MQSSRPRCQVCLRPQKTCICHLPGVIDNRLQVIILQHPKEEFESKGTGRLLHLCLKNSQLLVGEQFSEAQFLDILGDEPEQCYLLFPQDEVTPAQANENTQQQAEARLGQEISTHAPDKTAPKRLLIIDGTWRKARKMLKLNPRLEALPRLSLANCESRYRIRKAQKPGQLSTLEAAYHALSSTGEEAGELLEVFEQFMDMQMKWRPDNKAE